MVAAGFSSGPTCFNRTLGPRVQHVARDCVRGGAWRLFLAVGNVPSKWPLVSAAEEQSRDWLEAESPWFNYFTDLDPDDPSDEQLDDKGEALSKCLEWLLSIGIQWLDDPSARSPDFWRANHNILVKQSA